MGSNLSGHRILIVEGEVFIAAVNAEAVAGIVGPVATPQDAMVQVGFDAAVLDIDLRGERVYPVAEGADDVVVRHVPNASSGGRTSRHELVAFDAGQRGPEHQALLRLVGMLVDEGQAGEGTG